MKIFVWADKDSDKLGPLMHTARLHNIEPEILGADSEVKPDCFFKLSSLYNKVCQLDENEIVCCTDGFDVVYQDSPKSIKKKFLSFNCDIVFSAEKLYSHQFSKHKAYFKHLTHSPYKYLNAGCVIGYAKSLRELLSPKKSGQELLQAVCDKTFLSARKIIKNTVLRNFVKRINPIRHSSEEVSNGIYSDQTILGDRIIANRDKINIKLDYGCLLFWCVAGEWEDVGKHYEIINSKIVNKNTNSIPSCIHVPYTSKYMHVFLELYDLVTHNGNNKEE